ncbi:MAG TPA: hypothetical protein VLB44_17510 [Kofleriaceae bacterium]|nr:hypothetical protein [Kofleriaceae bacterium]
MKQTVQPPKSHDAAEQISATLRIDTGHVWLELESGERLATVEPASPLWTWAADARVVVRGACSEDDRFRIESLRMTTDVHPYVEVGPEVVVQGRLVREMPPAGSKLAGSPQQVFLANDGGRYGVLGEALPPIDQDVAVRARKLVADMSYAARSTEADLYILGTGDGPTAARSKPCP